MKSMQSIYKKQDGFTLVEMVMIIVLLGIFASMGAQFISSVFIGFKVTDSRLEIFEEGKLALTRMGREISNSIPNAIFVASDTDLRIGLIAENLMLSDNVTGRYTEDPLTNTITDETGFHEDNTTLSINNNSWNTFSNSDTNIRRVYQVASRSGNVMTLDRSVPAESHSARNRFYAVDKAVRYFYDSDSEELRRSEISIGAVNTSVDDAAFAAATSYPLATGVSNLEFTYGTGTSLRNSIVTIKFDITQNDETIQFVKEFHARNTP